MYTSRRIVQYCSKFFLLPRSRLCTDTSATIDSGLRWDTLAQIISFGSIYSGVQALVFDTTPGLVLGTVIHRMAGTRTAFVLIVREAIHHHFCVGSQAMGL
jgi:hypothetical protein